MKLKLHLDIAFLSTVLNRHLKSFSNKLKTLESKPKSSANINDALQFRFNKPKSIKSDDWDDGDGFHTIKHYNKDNY